LAARLPQHPDFAPGTLIGGRYRIIRFLAAGGMGRVYEADDNQRSRVLALKTLRAAVPVADRALSPRAKAHRALERLVREIAAARRVTHPNVCRVFDVGYHQVGGDEHAAIYLTMELLPGATLAQHLAATGKLTPAEALPMVRQIAAGLGAAHRASLVHRDLKCANVILTPDSREPNGLRAVITDFGQAHELGPYDSAMTGTGNIVGSPDYMAPEQIEGGAITIATDIYAFGVVLYELTTGARPFHGSPLTTIVRKLKERPPAPRTLVPELDPRWEEAILRCLEIAPSERYASVGELVAALATAPPSGSRGGWLRAAMRSLVGR
jgi:serine/threonine protein kinase